MSGVEEASLPEKGKKEDGEEEQEKDTKEKGDPRTEDCYRYEGETCVYTDPWTKKEYVLNDSKTDWIPREKEYEFDGKTYIHRDDYGRKRKWNLEIEKWETSESEMDSDEEEKPKVKRAMPGWNPEVFSKKDEETGVKTYKDPVDGTIYEWDIDKNAWFPKIDTDFMAHYQLNYGFTADGQAKPTMPTEKPLSPVKPVVPLEPVKKDKKVDWFEVENHKNTKVYVSGLPESITEEKFIEMMSKFGMIEVDVRNKNKPKIKVYKDSNGIFKGDALCTFVMVESVNLAIQMLDDSLYEDGRSRIRVERAKFEMKGNAYDPNLKPKKLNKKDLEKLKKQKNKKLAWELDDLRGFEARPKFHKVIVVSNLFSPSDFDDRAELILDIKSKLRHSCDKFGTVKRVELYDRHPDGIAMISFSDPKEADVAIENLNERLFNGRVMKAITWDGKSKYEFKETTEQEEARIEQWSKFLEDDQLKTDNDSH